MTVEQVNTPLQQVIQLNNQLEESFNTKLIAEPALTRTLVSFQANKKEPAYRWYKYKEAFSTALIDYLFERYGIAGGTMLDPFAGSGTALFTASSLGVNADGIELLPIGQEIIRARQIIQSEFTDQDYAALHRWSREQVWSQTTERIPLAELRITQGAYSEETKSGIEAYLAALIHEDYRVQVILRFALLCVLEEISFTRKDGQYLRWDARSGRRQGKSSFDKGYIPSFDEAISHKLTQIIADGQGRLKQGLLFPREVGAQGTIRLFAGSCLDILPMVREASYDAIITSPPYCNRYDYTRTYALELALLGTDERQLGALRQAMLSCTVENRAKDLLALNPNWQSAVTAADQQDLLQAVLNHLDDKKKHKELNNDGIPRMVRGYFYEMACVIAESLRVLTPGGMLFMVNDNVRYAGASISVDLILSAIAAQLGFEIERIMVLPTGKGNSSQQMGEHGREALRKCVYVWKKPAA